jgi:hypothetical protein
VSGSIDRKVGNVAYEEFRSLSHELEKKSGSFSSVMPDTLAPHMLVCPSCSPRINASEDIFGAILTYTVTFRVGKISNPRVLSNLLE